MNARQTFIDLFYADDVDFGEREEPKRGGGGGASDYHHQAAFNWSIRHSSVVVDVSSATELWFRAAVIAVPITGFVLLSVLVLVAVRMLRHDFQHRRPAFIAGLPAGNRCLWSPADPRRHQEPSLRRCGESLSVGNCAGSRYEKMASNESVISGDVVVMAGDGVTSCGRLLNELVGSTDDSTFRDDAGVSLV